MFETFAVVSTLSLIGIFVALVQLERAGRAEGTAIARPSGGGRMEDETFKREGPAPAKGDSGDSIDEMNDAAGESIERNIAPDDDSTSRRDRGGMKGTDTPATTNAEDRGKAPRTTM